MWPQALMSASLVSAKMSKRLDQGLPSVER